MRNIKILTSKREQHIFALSFYLLISSGNSDSIPIGSILAWNNNSTVPNDYLICNGSTFDTNQYPKLYQVLGTNILPNMNNSLRTDFDGYYAIGVYDWDDLDWNWGGNKLNTGFVFRSGSGNGEAIIFDSFKDMIHFTWNIKWIIKAK